MKKTEALSSQLLGVCFTLSDRLELLQTISQTRELLYLKTKTVDDLLTELRADHLEIFSQAWKQLFTKPTKSELNEVLGLIEKTIQHFSLVEIALPYHPTAGQLREIVLLLRKNFTDTAIVSVTHQPTLIAGILIHYNGQVIDLSTKKILSHD